MKGEKTKGMKGIKQKETTRKKKGHREEKTKRKKKGQTRKKKGHKGHEEEERARRTREGGKKQDRKKEQKNQESKDGTETRIWQKRRQMKNETSIKLEKMNALERWRASAGKRVAVCARTLWFVTGRPSSSGSQT